MLPDSLVRNKACIDGAPQGRRFFFSIPKPAHAAKTGSGANAGPNAKPGPG